MAGKRYVCDSASIWITLIYKL
jgi:hypothetical protein